MESAPGVGVVGTRKASPYGLLAANEFGKGLARAGFYGCIRHGVGRRYRRGPAAHSKQAAKTIAVLAGGLNICYPPAKQFFDG